MSKAFVYQIITKASLYQLITKASLEVSNVSKAHMKEIIVVKTL